MKTYLIEKTFNELKESIANTKIFYANESFNTKWYTKQLCNRIYNILDTANSWIYEIEKNNENMLKYINRILKAYEKVEKYTKQLSY